MSNINDYVIDNGIFKEYIGPTVEVLEIPEGVTDICMGAFDASRKNMTKCRKIIFPSSLKRVGDHVIRHNYDGWFDTLEELVFKGDVESIGEGAFKYIEPYGDDKLGKIGLRSIVFEGHVGIIEAGAFPRSRLTSVYAPNGIDKLGNWVFNGCMYLEEVIIPGLQSIGEECFLDCKKLKKLEIPETCEVSKGTFTGCEGLANKAGQFVFNGTLFNTRNNRGWDDSDKRKWKSIPTGVTTIDDYAIGYADSFCMPNSVTTINTQGSLYSKIRYAEDYFKTDKKLSGKGFFKLLEEQWVENLSAEDWAYLYLYQSGKNIEKILSKNKKDANAVAEGMLVALNKYGKEKHFIRAAEYILNNVHHISIDNLQKMYDFYKGKKSSKAACLLENYVTVDCGSSKEEPHADLKEIFNEHLLDKSIYKGYVDYFDEVRYADSEELAPAFIVKCAIVPYLDQYEGRPKKIGEYKTDYIKVNFVEGAEKAAALLNRNDLMNLVEKAILNAGTSGWYIPYGRYADRNQISELISKMRKWESWRDYAATGRSNIIIARGALMLSDTREAMMNLDKTGHLGVYAALRNTDADALRDTVLAEFGLDEAGHKEYDLGGKKITVTLEDDLSLSIYDESAKKIVKSIPKKGAEPELYEKAKEDFAEMKKNVKKVVQGRVDLLFESFLTGAKRRVPESWINSYTKNPVLRQIASLIVWNQGDDTFIMTKDGAVTSDGVPYVFKENVEIGVAHPIEMKAEAVSSWQKYFTSRNLKQPFPQIWEPVLNPKEVTKDRYVGCMIPFYRFRSQKKHGIHVEDYDFHNEIDIFFSGCRAEVERIDWERHEINNDDRFEVKSIEFRTYTRQVNHILTYLDRITIYDRIKKDDITIEKYLPSFTLAQITEFLQIAAENNCTNVTSILLDYKNANYADFDPMEEFSLDF